MTSYPERKNSISYLELKDCSFQHDWFSSQIIYPLMHQYCNLNIFDVYFLEKLFPWFYFTSLSMGASWVLEDAFLCKDVRLFRWNWGLNLRFPQWAAQLWPRFCTVLASILYSTPRTCFCCSALEMSDLLNVQP